MVCDDCYGFAFLVVASPEPWRVVITKQHFHTRVEPGTRADAVELFGWHQRDSTDNVVVRGRVGRG